MTIKKILICGDSFSADWTVKYPNGNGWPNLLAKEFSVTNLSQAGCSEYKIYKQLKSQDLHRYSHLIISHTSPNRIPVDIHPVHYNDKLHKNADLIYNDIKYHAAHNRELNSIIDFFENYFNLDYAHHCFKLIQKEIDELLIDYCRTLKVMHITNLMDNDFHNFVVGTSKNYFDLTKSNKGLHNHFNDFANNIVYNDLKEFINELY